MKKSKKKLTDNTKRRYKTLVLVDAIFVILYLAVSLFFSCFRAGAPLGLAVIGLQIMVVYLLFMIIHGIASYLKYRSVFFPNIVIAIFSLVSLLFVYLLAMLLVYLSVLHKCFDLLAVLLCIWSCYTVVVSIISSVITMLIVKLCKLIKSKRNPTAKTE